MTKQVAMPSRPTMLAALTALTVGLAPAPAAAARAGSHRAPASRAPHAHARGAGAGCAGAGLTVASAPAQELRDAVVCLVNREREVHHLPALRALRRLDRAAQSWTDRMLDSHSFSHAAGGSDPGSRISAAGYQWWAFGENIATGFATPQQVVAAWMGSEGHCRNILGPQFTDVGTGVSDGAVAGFGSGGGTWTQDFGRPAGTRAPSRNMAAADGCPYRA
jgi:uncharacterized protein YkwD